MDLCMDHLVFQQKRWGMTDAIDGDNETAT